MEKHTSLLMTTYLCGLSLGVAAALSATLSASIAAPTGCLHPSCQLLLHTSQTSVFFIVAGAVSGLGTVLLSRGLYRLFFTESH